MIKHKTIIIVLISIISICLIGGILYPNLIEGISEQNGSIIATSLSGLSNQIDMTNSQLQTLFTQIQKLPLTTSKNVYDNIINDTSITSPLLKYKKIQNTIASATIGPAKNDGALVNTFLVNDPSAKTVNDTNTALNGAFTTIINSNIGDLTYLNILNNTNSEPIEKYLQLMNLVKNKTNWSN
jgi:hypothetical protein